MLSRCFRSIVACRLFLIALVSCWLKILAFFEVDTIDLVQINQFDSPREPRGFAPKHPHAGWRHEDPTGDDNGSFLRGERTMRTIAETCVGDERLVFLHIPKTAGTAIEDAGHEVGVKWGRFMNPAQECQADAGCNAEWHTPPAWYGGISVYTNATVFCVVRDPFARAISEYQFYASHPEYSWLYAEAPLPKDSCSPEGLNAFLVFVLGRYLENDTTLGMCHILPQTHYIYGPPDADGNREQTCQEVLRLEEFPKAFDDLMVRYGYSVKLPDAVNTGECDNLTVDVLSDDVKRLIRRVYAVDFQRLGYSDKA